jgi:hypothetical protein
MAGRSSRTQTAHLPIGPRQADPAQDPYWDVAAAVAWIMTRAFSSLCEVMRWPWVTELDFAILDARLVHADVEHTNFKEAMSQLWNKAEAGEITAYGKPLDRSPSRAIQAFEWRDLKLGQQHGKCVVLCSRRNPSEGYEDVVFKREEVERIWPSLPVRNGHPSDSKRVDDAARPPSPIASARSRRTSPALERAAHALATLYPGGIPEQKFVPNVELFDQVNKQLLADGHPAVSKESVLRAACRRRQ